jgi:hypothetical protein
MQLPGLVGVLASLKGTDRLGSTELLDMFQLVGEFAE